MQLKKLKNIILIIFFPTLLFGQNDYFKSRMDSIWLRLNDSTFFNILDKENLVFNMPDPTYKVTKVIKNYDTFYHYAVQNDSGTFEIRYYIQPIGINKLDTTKAKLDNISYSMFSILTLNASGSNWATVPEIQMLELLNIDKSLTYNWEATTEFVPKSEFGNTYKYCKIFARRINDSSLLYYFLLFSKDYADNKLARIALETIKNKSKK